MAIFQKRKYNAKRPLLHFTPSTKHIPSPPPDHVLLSTLLWPQQPFPCPSCPHNRPPRMNYQDVGCILHFSFIFSFNLYLLAFTSFDFPFQLNFFPFTHFLRFNPSRPFNPLPRPFPSVSSPSPALSSEKQLKANLWSRRCLCLMLSREYLARVQRISALVDTSPLLLCHDEQREREKER